MKRISILLLAAATSALLLNSCIKETFPTSGATATQVANSEAGLFGLVRAIPSQMTNYFNIWPDDPYHCDFGYPSILMYLNSMTGDLVVTGEDYYNQFYYWMSGQWLEKEYGLPDLFWYTYYPYIKSCNDVINTVKAAAATDEEMNSTQKAAMGIALTYRAQFYLDLVRLYEPKECTDPQIVGYTIPEEIKGLSCVIITEDTTEEEARHNPRAKVEDVYELIFSDLTRAEAYLEEYIPDSKQMPSLAVVYGVFARAYLERGDAMEGAYAKAAEYARKAIDEGSYSPLTQSEWEDPTTGFNSANSNNSWMWCISYTESKISNIIGYVANMSIEELWTTYGYQVARGINSHLYNQIADDDFRKHSWLDPLKYDYYDYKSCLPEGSFTVEGTTYRGYKDFFTNYHEPYASIKFRPAQGNYSDYKVGNVSDIPRMRIEEMYLIEAEALGATDLAAGKDKLNTFVRSYRSPSFTSEATDFRSFQEEVADQVRIEFWGEAIPFWYKKRLALGIHLANSNCKIDDHRFECDGVIPWWNIVISQSEEQTNDTIEAFNNPEPSGTLSPIFE